MMKKKLPKGCRVDPETGGVECEEGAKKMLEPSDDEQGALFNRAPVEYEELHCVTDKRDGSFRCKGRFKAEKKPQS